MSVAETFQLDVGNLDIASFIDVVFELSEFAFGAEKLCASDVEFGDLSWIEDKGHVFGRLTIYYKKISASYVLPGGPEFLPTGMFLIDNQHSLLTKMLPNFISLRKLPLPASLIPNGY
jgi:hypothetical protein